MIEFKKEGEAYTWACGAHVVNKDQIDPSGNFGCEQYVATMTDTEELFSSVMAMLDEGHTVPIAMQTALYWMTFKVLKGKNLRKGV